MHNLEDKYFKILSTLLLSQKPITTTKIAEVAGYPRKTVAYIINKLVIAGYIIDDGRDGAHGWIANTNHDIFAKFADISDTTTTILQKYDKNPKWIHLIDADSTIPNVALMKISAYHKARSDRVTFSRGKTVGFARSAPDRIYVSIIFKKNAEMFSDLSSSFPNTIVDIGGSGVDLKKTLPPEIEACAPDYSIYPRNKSSIGFSSRGCIRTTKTCPWCIVPVKEGFYFRTQHPELWYNPAFKKITFLDNNALVDKPWFMTVTSWCIEKNLKVWFTQGLDIRLVDSEIARRLVELPRHQMTTFAWDRLEDETTVKSKIELLKQNGFDDALLRAKVQFYVYVDNDSDEEFNSGVYRCRELKKLQCNAYIMYNVDNKISQRITQLKQWSNAKMHFWRCDIDEYRQSARISA
jgi:hypothetical protein